MSEVRDTLATTIADRQPAFGDLVTNVRTRSRFYAECEPVADIEANVMLGRDARESVLFHIADRAAAAGIQLGDELLALGTEFQVLRRTDNPASLQVEFGAMKITELG